MSNRSLVSLLVLLLSVFLAVKFDVPTRLKVGVMRIIYGNEITRLDGVLVQVEIPNPDIASNGLTGESVRDDLVAKLAKAGVKSLPQDLWQKTPGKPSLTLSVLAVKQAGEIYQYTVTIDLDKSVGEDPAPGNEKRTPLWSTEKTGEGNISAIRTDINEITHVFLQAHGTPSTY